MRAFDSCYQWRGAFLRSPSSAGSDKTGNMLLSCHSSIVEPVLPRFLLLVMLAIQKTWGLDYGPSFFN